MFTSQFNIMAPDRNCCREERQAEMARLAPVKFAGNKAADGSTRSFHFIALSSTGTVWSRSLTRRSEEKALMRASGWGMRRCDMTGMATAFTSSGVA